LSSGWSYEEVLPFFKISEDNRDYIYAKDNKHHAVGGPQPVQVPKFQTPIGPAFLVRNFKLKQFKLEHYLNEITMQSKLLFWQRN
jgi:hypothetical protein